MTIAQLKKKLEEGTGLKVAYRNFLKKQELPFLIIFEDKARRYGGDKNKNLLFESSKVIELYSETKNLELEGKIENVLIDFEIEKTEAYISDERMLLTRYDIEETSKTEV